MQIHIHLALRCRPGPLGLPSVVTLLVPMEIVLVFFVAVFHLYLSMYIYIQSCKSITHRQYMATIMKT